MEPRKVVVTFNPELPAGRTEALLKAKGRIMSRGNIFAVSTMTVFGFFYVFADATAQQPPPSRTDYDVLILNGRVMDPESWFGASPS